MESEDLNQHQPSPSAQASWAFVLRIFLGQRPRPKAGGLPAVGEAPRSQCLWPRWGLGPSTGRPPGGSAGPADLTGVVGSLSAAHPPGRPAGRPPRALRAPATLSTPRTPGPCGHGKGPTERVRPPRLHIHSTLRGEAPASALTLPGSWGLPIPARSEKEAVHLRKVLPSLRCPLGPASSPQQPCL